MILRSTLGPNLKGKLKFRCILCTHTFMMQWSYRKRAVTESFTDHEARPWPWRLSRLMPDTVDEMCAGANIFTFARNTVCVHRRLQRTGIPSYHRRHRQQMRSRTRWHAFVDASTFTDASANVHMYTQLCADAYMSVNASTTRLHAFTDVFTETASSTHLCCTVCAVSCYSPQRVAGGKVR